MPQFAWKGIGLEGLDQSGVQEARSYKQLDAMLLSNNIALLEASVILPYSRLRPIPVAARTAFFEQLATLIEAGVYLDAALNILYEQTIHRGFVKVLFDVSKSVQEGSQLHEALSVYPQLFDSVVVHVIRSGEEAGTLPVALTAVARYLAFREQFRTALRRVCMLPAITCVFFVLVAGIIIGFIVPSFASLYQSAGKQLPGSTQTLLWMSSWVSLSGFAVLALCLAGLYGCWRVMKHRETFICIYEGMLLHMPVIGSIMCYGNLLAYMKALAILTSGGVHVAPALQLALGTLSMQKIRNTFCGVAADVEKGKHVSRACSDHALTYCNLSVIALMRVGEESGRLDRAFEHVADAYEQQLEKTSGLVTTFVHPILMIVLGLMITALIFAVYVPIFNLSEAVS